MKNEREHDLVHLLSPMSEVFFCLNPPPATKLLKRKAEISTIVKNSYQKFLMSFLKFQETFCEMHRTETLIYEAHTQKSLKLNYF